MTLRTRYKGFQLFGYFGVWTILDQDGEVIDETLGFESAIKLIDSHLETCQ